MSESETSSQLSTTPSREPGEPSPRKGGKVMTINPIEVVILGSITLLLGQGILNLFDTKSLAPTMHSQNSAFNGTSSPLKTGRSLASKGQEITVTPKLAQLDIRCDTGKLETASTRIRLSGPLCGLSESGTTSEPRRLVKSHVLNQANQYQATVFSDPENGKFTTDYIPLVAGTNTFKVEFIYASGKHATQELVILKN